MQLIIEMDPARRMQQIDNLISALVAENASNPSVDLTGDLNEISKLIEAPLKEAKTILKGQCETQKVKLLPGVRYNMTVAQSSDWDINPINLVKWLKDHAKMELFPNVVKPIITAIKQYLGAEMLKEVGTQNINEYGSARFKKKG